ncbi:portal protein [Luteolibacter sp. Populi]|uniref:portal protein n=1 Tax=Luteolibacter sp. Populi TaxID=3230487 RepID=UPI00346726BF
MMTGEDVIRTREELAGLRAPFEGHWNELAEIFTPFRRIGQDAPDLLDSAAMFDSTPRQSAQIFANGLCSLIVPREEQWFEFVPEKGLGEDDEAQKWYREASETAHGYLEASNFYEEMQEALFESGVHGTCSLYCGELDEKGELCFLNQTVGTYYIAEDAKGRVNVHVRDLSLTADQAADEFGKEALPRKIAGMVGTPRGMSERHDFVHLVAKRRGDVPEDAPENLKLPYVDLVVCAEDKAVVRRSGLNDFSFAVHRYAKHGKCVYGFGPGALAKGDSRQLSFLNELADLGTEKAVFPPLLASADLEGEIAQGALEVTYRDPNSAGSDVRELHSQSRYDILKDRLADKKEMVQQAFHVDLFKLFSMRSRDRAPLTATEANMIAGEKFTQFSPVYGRIMNEMIDVVLARVFAVLFRAGKFGEAPESVKGSQGGGRIRYKNKIALAMQAKENGSLSEFFGLLMPMLQVFPEMGRLILNAYNPELMVRDLIRNSGQPERWLATVKEMQARGAAQAEAMAERAQLENAGMAAKAGMGGGDANH